MPLQEWPGSDRIGKDESAKQEGTVSPYLLRLRADPKVVDDTFINMIRAQRAGPVDGVRNFASPHINSDHLIP
jgi:hypothetical protein